MDYASLVLADVVAIPPAGSPFFQLVHDHSDVLAQVPAYIHEAPVRAYIGNAGHRGLRADDLAELAAPWLGDQGQPAFYPQIAQYDERFLVEKESLLEKIAIPVTVLRGTEDTWIPLETGERLTGLVPGATITRIERAGHLLHLDAPIRLASELRKWLTRLTEPRPTR